MPHRKTGRSVFFRLTIGIMLLSAFALLTDCQTPPRKKNAASSNASARSRDAGMYQTETAAGRERGLDLFSSSAERFGSDPRVSRPILVSDTVWIAVVSLVVLVSGAALVSGVRSARAGRSSRRRT